MKLVNVRLSDDDAAKVAELQRQGVELSEVVREAVRARHLALRPALTAKDVKPLLEAIFARHPLDPNDMSPAVDTTDRRAVAKLIRSKLRRRK